MTGSEILPWSRKRNVANLCDIFLSACNSDKKRAFCVSGDLNLSYEQALHAVQGFAAKYGAGLNGQDVAIFMSNGIPALITYLSVLWSGGRPALLNAAMPKATGKKLMDALNPAMVFSDHPLDFDSHAVCVENELILHWASLKADTKSACGAGDMPATYFYSGGTTGVPKRVLYTHEKILSAGERMQWGWPMRDGEVFLPIAPFSHIYGYLMGICVPLQCAGTTVFPDRFKPTEVLDLVEREKVTVLGGGPPAIYLGLMSDPTLSSRDLSALRVCPGGGAPFPLDVHKRWKEATGLTIFEGYGMTEMAPICVNQAGDGLRPGSAGRVVPDSAVSIVDLITGTQVMPVGEAGEIRILGPHGMDGYCDNPEETTMVLRDGWIHTGDIGVLDRDGFLTITDRKKDVILHKGFNVFPREVEEALMSHSSISNVCVVGKIDARNGENIVAFVTSTAVETTTQEELVEHCRQYLVPYRLPNQIIFCESLDLTPAGKVDRLALRERAQELTI
ncbi:MAG: long-chain acyl-CoA synthetase [Celeribacter sp.]|jgi:long-chain acyl-CoA synthetase